MQFEITSFGEESLICLCHKCRRDYLAAGYAIRKAQVYQIEMDICTRCNYRSGYDYYISNGASRNRQSMRDGSAHK